MQPVMFSKSTLWDTYTGKRFRKIIEAQKAGKRGGLYDQSGYPKLANGEVKLVFAALYSLEQGFMMNNNFLLGFLNVLASGGPLRVLGINLFGENGHLRDYLMSLFAKYPGSRIKELKDREYWDELLTEIDRYRQEHNREQPIAERNIHEMKVLMPLAYPQGKNVISRGTYRIVDRNWDPGMETDGILTVLTIEGMANVTQTKIGASDSRHGTLSLSEQTIWSRLRYLKSQTPVFFVTFSHHFSSGLCGHARSFPDKARKLGILNQEYFLNEGFSELGYRVLQFLLGIRRQDGKWVRDPGAGRRILIDVKHMSLKGRTALYQIVEQFNADPDHAARRIPIVASHVGFSNLSIGQMLYNIRSGRETSKTQPMESVEFGRHQIFNTWSINLGMEEIGIIVRSGGLIGVSLEQNNLGIPFGARLKKKPETYFTDLVFNQILAMARAADHPEFWRCITMGTDFDGLIDPVDRYSSALFFDKLRTDLEPRFLGLSWEEKQLAHLPQQLDPPGLAPILDNLFYGNARDFLARNFDPVDMPGI